MFLTATMRLHLDAKGPEGLPGCPKTSAVKMSDINMQDKCACTLLSPAVGGELLNGLHCKIRPRSQHRCRLTAVTTCTCSKKRPSRRAVPPFLPGPGQWKGTAGISGWSGSHDAAPHRVQDWCDIPARGYRRVCPFPLMFGEILRIFIVLCWPGTALWTIGEAWRGMYESLKGQFTQN